MSKDMLAFMLFAAIILLMAFTVGVATWAELELARIRAETECVSP